MSETPRTRLPIARTTTRPGTRFAQRQIGRDLPAGPRSSLEQQLPLGHDPFPLIMGGLVGALLVGIGLVMYVISTRSDANIDISSGNIPRPTTAANSTGAGDSSNQGTLTDAAGTGTPLPGTAVPEEGKDHVEEGTPIVYKSYPPSSGTHYGSTAEYGFSEQEIPAGKLVHNLEHGAVVLYYKPDLPSSALQNLHDAYTRLPPAKYGEVKLVIAPDPKLRTPLAIASWGRVQPLSEFDFAAVSAFYTALVDKGPEDVP